jgi:hypothetical protein
MLRAGLSLVALAATSALLSGCAGSAATGAAPPESASLAPADALVYATVTTDSGSEQWQKAEKLLERIPGAREGLSQAVSSSLQEQGLDWATDVEPAIGPELVVVVTAARKPVVLVRPESEAKLDALLAKGDQALVRGSVDGWVALAQSQADLDAYRSALGRGTIVDVQAFTDGFAALPADGLARVWVDAAALSKDLGNLVPQGSSELDLGLDWISASVSAEDDGALVTMGMRTPGGADTSYEPELFHRVPADAVAAVSFGGTQSTLDRLDGKVDLDALSKKIEDATGVSLDGVLDALSGEGVLYVRPAGQVPEVTLALRPPDPDKTWDTVERLARTLAEQSGGTIRVTTQGGHEVRYLETDQATLRWTRLEDDTILVTTGADAVAAFTSDGDKLADSDRYRRAAEVVGLEGRTRGFVYVDFDALLSLVRSLGGQDSVPPDAADALGSLDSLVLEASGDGDTTRVSGFVRLGS